MRVDAELESVPVLDRPRKEGSETEKERERGICYEIRRDKPVQIRAG